MIAAKHAVSSMSEVTTIGLLRQSSSTDPTSREVEVSEGFSYALAQSTLEARASTSLNAHGATPNTTGFSISDRSQTTTNSDTGLRSESSATDPIENRTTNSIRATAQQSLVQPQSSSATLDALPTTLVSAQPQAPASRLALVPNSLSTLQRSEARTAQSPLQNNNRLRGSQQADLQKLEKPQAATKNEFAQLVAKKISERSSSFELRLDPPELGRIEGKIRVSDDGKAVLALNFDNEATLDLFSRDASGLRLALSEAGVDADTSEFEFALIQETSPSIASEEIQSTNTVAAQINTGTQSLIDVWT